MHIMLLAAQSMLQRAVVSTASSAVTQLLLARHAASSSSVSSQAATARMNMCNAVNDALHVSLDSNSRHVPCVILPTCCPVDHR
jgi:hypothetical protein